MWSRSTSRDSGVANTPCETSRLEVGQDNPRHVFGLDVAVKCRAATRLDQFDQRRLMAHADAADLFDSRRRARFGQHILDRFVDPAASLGNATGAEPDTDFRRPSARYRQPPGACVVARRPFDAGNRRAPWGRSAGLGDRRSTRPPETAGRACSNRRRRLPAG